MLKVAASPILFGGRIFLYCLPEYMDGKTLNILVLLSVGCAWPVQTFLASLFLEPHCCSLVIDISKKVRNPETLEQSAAFNCWKAMIAKP